MYSSEAKMLAKPMSINHFRTQKQERSLSIDQEQDLNLVHRIACKDESALQQLYADHGRSLYTYALRLTGDAAQAEDVVQDVMIVVWQTADKFRGEGRLVSWLLGIVHHTAVKSMRRRSNPITDELERSMQTQDPLPEEQVLLNLRSQSVRQGLQQLSSEHRAVLELFFYQGMSLQEAAAICRCPLGTIKSRLNYARRLLRRLLSRLEEI